MLTRVYKNIFFLIHKWGWRNIVIGLGGVVIGVIVILHFVSSNTATVTPSSTPVVAVSSVAELSAASTPLSVVGTVSSEAEATVRAESGGAVVHVYHNLGDSVAAGTIVAELEDSGARAAVLQAQGSLDAAQANMSKVAVGVDTAKSSAVNALLSAYSGVDSALRGTVDTMISNASSNNPQFVVNSSNSELVSSINNTRPTLTPLWTRETTRAATLTLQDDLSAELSQTIAEVRTVRTFVDTIVNALNSGIPSTNVPQATIATYLAAATAARAALTSTLSSLTSAQETLTNAQTEGGGASPDTAAAQAQVTVAQGALAAARANLEKSIIRSPISGTINSFSLKVGDYVSQLSPVLTVANNHALEIVAYVSQLDAAQISVGSPVSIEGDGAGVVTRLSPAVDPTTKRVELRIGVSGDSSLVNGQSVLVDLKRTTPSIPTAKPARITIPIAALKVGATETDVFTVASSTLVAHKVTIGELLGDSVVIESGLTPDMLIVTDARGLREGETVEIGTNL